VVEMIKNFLIYYLIGLLVMCSLPTLTSAQYPYETCFALSLGMSPVYIFAIIWFVLWLLVSVWVYRDAKKRDKNGVLWIIIVIILGIIGFIIWLLVRGEVPISVRKCSNCGRPLPSDAKVCPYCGK
jgi:heme/copper-type cytochrome/quinol oxidase subunit 4